MKISSVVPSGTAAQFPGLRSSSGLRVELDMMQALLESFNPMTIAIEVSHICDTYGIQMSYKIQGVYCGLHMDAVYMTANSTRA